jgi:hypothetical protein
MIKIEESEKPQSFQEVEECCKRAKGVSMIEVISADSDSSDDESSVDNDSSAKTQSQIVFSKTGNLMCTNYNASTVSQVQSSSSTACNTHCKENDYQSTEVSSSRYDEISDNNSMSEMKVCKKDQTLRSPSISSSDDNESSSTD